MRLKQYLIEKKFMGEFSFGFELEAIVYIKENEEHSDEDVDIGYKKYTQVSKYIKNFLRTRK